jgi:phage shock protein A
METSSTDKRLDEFSDRQDRFEKNVDRRFEAVDRRFDSVDRRFERFEDKVDARFDLTATKEQLEKLDARFDRWGKIVSGGTVTIVAAVILKVFGV